jgi:hypothetical protein
MSASFCDLEKNALAALGTARPNDRAERASDPTVTADHLAKVVVRHVQAEDDRITAVDSLDGHRIGRIDEVPGDVGDELLHRRA